MNKASTNAFILLIVCFAALTQAQISQEYIKQSEAFVRSSIDQGNVNFENLYKEGFNYKVLGDLNIIQSSNTCSFLQKLGDIHKLLDNSKSIYYFLKLKEMIPKCNIEYQTSTLKEVLIQESANIETAEKLFYVTALGYELKIQQIQPATCNLVAQFYFADGNSKVHISSADNRNNIATGFILETIQLCGQNQTLRDVDIAKNLDVLMESLLLNSIQIEEKQTCFLESTSTLEVTAKLYKLFHTLPIQSTQAYKVFVTQYKNNILNFLKNNANSQILTPSERFELVNIYQTVKDSDAVVIKRGTYDLKNKQLTVFVRFENILGEASATIQPLKAALYRRNKLVQADIVATNSTNELWPLTFKINSASVTETGFHQLKISLNETEILVEKLLLTTSLSAKSIEFEIAQGKGKIPKKYTHSYNTKSKKPEKVTANQNSFLYVQFSIGFANEKYQFAPSQVAIRLRHPTFSSISHLVNADFDEISNQYLAIVDFGDPFTILPYSSTYEAELIVADQRLTTQVVHNFATIETTFKTNRNDKNPPNDADYLIPKPIDHVINDEIKSPPMTFILSIVFMMAVCLAFFFVMIKKIDLNWVRFSNLTSLEKVYVELFIVSILIAFGLLLVFWVKINLMETVTYISFGLIPFLIIGNLALTSLSKDEKNE